MLPVSLFFAVNAASFFVSALLINRLRHGEEHDPHAAAPSIREGISALRPRPALAAGVVALGLAVTFTAGAGAVSIVMVGYAVGSIASGAVLARVPVAHKARVSLLAWCLYLPAYGLIAFAHSLPLVVAGSFFAATGQSTSVVLLNSAAQENVPDALLGRVLGVISLTHRGAHATGLLLVSPLFAVVSARAVFGASAVAVPLIGLSGLAVAARAHGTRRSRRS